jgi:hypothetical protein
MVSRRPSCSAWFLRRAPSLLVALGCVFFTARLGAQSGNWTGTDSTDWFDANNWSPNGVPGNSTNGSGSVSFYN